MSVANRQAKKDVLDSLTWFQELPNNWRTLRLKAVIRTSVNGVWGNEPLGNEDDLVCIRVADFDMQKFGVSQNNLTYRNVTKQQRFRRLLKPNDLLIEKSGGGELQPVGRVISYDLEEPAVCSNFIARIEPESSIVASKFLLYVFQTMWNSRVTVPSIKQTTGIQNLDDKHYFSNSVPIPPRTEQNAIVAFLDERLADIDRYIAAKQRLIELLNEQKAAIINRAVTRGLDPDVEMKESGIEWLGEIPAHWIETKLKFVGEVQTGLTLGKSYINIPTEDRPYLRVANVQDGYLDLTSIAKIQIPRHEAIKYELKAGDVLMTEGGDRDKLGRGHIWNDEIEGCLHQNHVFAVRVNNDRLLPNYLVMLTSSTHGRNFFWLTAKKTTNLASINSTTLRSFPVFLPGIQEQKQILDFIEEQTRIVEVAIEKANHEIDLMQELRTALISEAVTGKLDVKAGR